MSQKKHIIFVDDEQRVLEGLRRMLRSMRSVWEMTFALSGEEALQLLDHQQYDVIVADMRMPGMSGEELLTEVRKRYPGIVRLVLSGQADRAGVLKSVGPIHQFLQKPCDENTLKSTVARTIELGELFADEALRTMVAELESLPSLSARQREMIDILQMPDVSPRLVGEAISRDVGMAAKMLQLVNSAFFGLRRRIGSPAESVTLLGLDAVRSLVTTMQLFSRVKQVEVKGFSQDSLLTHSAGVAAIAKQIAAMEGASKEETEDAYLAGLLHDVGKLVLAAQRPAEFKAAISLAATGEMQLAESERQIIGASHAEVGGYLLGLWAFDSAVVDAALYHHRPNRHCSNAFTALTAVHVANAIVHQDPEPQETELAVDRAYLDRIGVSDRLDAWRGMSKSAA